MTLPWWHGVLVSFFTALGVVLGGAILGALATLFTAQSPISEMRRLAESVRLWAVVCAMGGTFSTLRAFETGILGGELALLTRQLLVIISGFAGSWAGRWIIGALVGGGGT